MRNDPRSTCTVKSTVENLSPTRVRLAVQVPFDELKPSLDAAYKKIGSQVRVPGFRPGKVPARIIDQRIGRGAVLDEAMTEALPGLYGGALREHDIQAVGRPEIEVTDLTDGESISFTAEVDRRPEITLPDLSALSVTVDDVSVSDEDVQQQLDALRERFGSLKGVERPVQLGDYVSLDLAASVDGRPVEAGSAKGMSYEVGSGNLLDGLDDALVGISAGGTATFTTTLVGGEQAGAEAQVEATVNSVKEKELPEADDEFAQLASEFDTIDELRADLRERLGRVRTLEQGAQARDRLVEKLIEAVEFPVPESAVAAEVEAREHEVVHSLNHDDALFERWLETQEMTREQFTAELHQDAERAVRGQYLLDEIAKKSDVQIGDAELTEYLVRQAARYNMAPQDFANEIVKAGNLPALALDLRRNKALAELLETVSITDASGNAIDLSALLQSGSPADLLDDDLADDVDGLEDDVDGDGSDEDA
jgi:trigger factor